MNDVIEYINKAENIEDQVIIGLNRVSANVKTAVVLLTAARQANIGDDTNAVLDALIAFAAKFQTIVGVR